MTSHDEPDMGNALNPPGGPDAEQNAEEQERIRLVRETEITANPDENMDEDALTPIPSDDEQPLPCKGESNFTHN